MIILFEGSQKLVIFCYEKNQSEPDSRLLFFEKLSLINMRKREQLDPSKILSHGQD